MSDVLKALELRFTSGNDVPVSRSHITRDEYDRLRDTVARQRAWIDSVMAQEAFAYGVEFDGLHQKEPMVNLSAGILREFVGEPFALIPRPAPFEDK